MRTKVARAALIAAILFLTGACATSEDWGSGGLTARTSRRASTDSSRSATTRTPPTQGVPLRHRGLAAENWWGNAITVSPDQIFQN